MCLFQSLETWLTVFSFGLLETGDRVSGICLCIECYRCELYILQTVLSLIIYIFSVVKSNCHQVSSLSSHL